MAILEGDLVTITLVNNTLGGVAMYTHAYEVTSGVGGIEGVALAEAWWDYVKDEYRALIRSSTLWFYSSVIVREENDPTGVLAEWNIPTGEQNGTRTGVDASEYLPPFNAAGARLTVGSRATRPGQKRVGGLLEVDSNHGQLGAPYVVLFNALLDELTETLTLAAPAATFNLTPNVFRRNAAGVVTAHQEVTGYVVNLNITSQVSRKVGRGI